MKLSAFACLYLVQLLHASSSSGEELPSIIGQSQPSSSVDSFEKEINQMTTKKPQASTRNIVEDIFTKPEDDVVLEEKKEPDVTQIEVSQAPVNLNVAQKTNLASFKPEDDGPLFIIDSEVDEVDLPGQESKQDSEPAISSKDGPVPEQVDSNGTGSVVEHSVEDEGDAGQGGQSESGEDENPSEAEAGSDNQDDSQGGSQDFGEGQSDSSEQESDGQQGTTKPIKVEEPSSSSAESVDTDTAAAKEPEGFLKLLLDLLLIPAVQELLTLFVAVVLALTVLGHALTS